MSLNENFLPAPQPLNEERRLEAVKKSGLMDVDNKDLFVIYNELAKQISNFPFSYTGIIDETRQYILCQVGLPDDMPNSIPREDTFCQYTLNSTEPLIVENLRNHKIFKYHPIVEGPPFLKFYAGFPIVTESGYVLGTLCINHSDENAKLSKEQINLLVKLTSKLAHQLEIQYKQREISAAKTIELLSIIQKNLPDFDIPKLIGFLNIVQNGQNDDQMNKILKNCDLIDDDGNLSILGRNLQKQIGLDSGIYKKIVVQKDTVSSNLDNMLDELGDL